jgi:hypothetical protein
MLIRGLVVVAALVTLGQGAIAGEKSTVLWISCPVVRFYATRYSEVAAAPPLLKSSQLESAL